MAEITACHSCGKQNRVPALGPGRPSVDTGLGVPDAA